MGGLLQPLSDAVADIDDVCDGRGAAHVPGDQFAGRFWDSDVIGAQMRDPCTFGSSEIEYSLSRSLDRSISVEGCQTRISLCDQAGPVAEMAPERCDAGMRPIGPISVD
jgi:hypothetical protein